MVLLDPKTEKPIDLFFILKTKQHLDMKIMLNNEARTIVRLLAFPVSKEIADNRRRKAKTENKKDPTEEYLGSLSWSVYITAITDESIDYTFIYKAYRLRWRIEIIFKCWKSNMGFDKIHNVSKIQLKVILLARFIMVTCIQSIFNRCKEIIKTNFMTDLSLLKFTKYLIRHSATMVGVVEELNNEKPKEYIKALSKFCAYDKRKRLNHTQKMDALFS
jgi:Transposase DDE domain